MFRLHPEDESAAVLLRQNHPAVTNERLAEALAKMDRPATVQPPPGRLLTIDQTAERLNISKRAVWRLLKDGRLPRRKPGSRTTRIPESAVIALAEGREGGAA